jgi:hypothetical protein
MKIKSVKLMRDIRNQISNDIENMDWKEECKYLNQQIKTFGFLTKPSPNTTLNSDPSATAIFSRNSKLRVGDTGSG